MPTFTANTTPNEVILGRLPLTYSMSLNASDDAALRRALAFTAQQSGTRRFAAIRVIVEAAPVDPGGMRHLALGREAMITVLDALRFAGDGLGGRMFDEAYGLRSSILATIGIEEV